MIGWLIGLLWPPLDGVRKVISEDEEDCFSSLIKLSSSDYMLPLAAEPISSMILTDLSSFMSSCAFWASIS